MIFKDRDKWNQMINYLKIKKNWINSIVDEIDVKFWKISN